MFTARIFEVDIRVVHLVITQLGFLWCKSGLWYLEIVQLEFLS